MRIKYRIFAQQIATVAAVNTLVTNPRGHHNILREVVKLHGVVVATGDPLLDAHVMVELEGIHIAVPHVAGGVIRPTLDGHAASELVSAVYKLHRLNTLLAKATVVQSLNGPVKICVGKKGLHAPSIGHAVLDSRVLI